MQITTAAVRKIDVATAIAIKSERVRALALLAE